MTCLVGGRSFWKKQDHPLPSPSQKHAVGVLAIAEVFHAIVLNPFIATKLAGLPGTCVITKVRILGNKRKIKFKSLNIEFRRHIFELMA